MTVIIYYDYHRNYHCHSSFRNNSGSIVVIPDVIVVVTVMTTIQHASRINPNEADKPIPCPEIQQALSGFEQKS